MNHQDLTDVIVKLCQECTVWSSNISIPVGKAEFIDISSAARGDQSSIPEGVKNQPEHYPKRVHASCYMFDSAVYGENSWRALHSMLTKVGCFSGCKLVLRQSKRSNHYRKLTHYLWCSHGLVMKDQSKSVYQGDNVGKSNVKKEHLK
jgi:hypothetical protein